MQTDTCLTRDQPFAMPWSALTMAVLLVLSAGCSKPAAVAGAQVADKDVTEHVTTALNQAPALQGANIAVVTLKGDVRLTGQLASQAQIDEALRIARAADGVHAIHDELVLRP